MQVGVVWCVKPYKSTSDYKVPFNLDTYYLLHSGLSTFWMKLRTVLTPQRKFFSVIPSIISFAYISNLLNKIVWLYLKNVSRSTPSWFSLECKPTFSSYIFPFITFSSSLKSFLQRYDGKRNHKTQTVK